MFIKFACKCHKFKIHFTEVILILVIKMLSINFKKNNLHNCSATFIFLDDQLKIDDSLNHIDAQCHELITEMCKNNKHFTGKFGQIYTLNNVVNEQLHYFCLVGVGDTQKIKYHMIEQLGGKILMHANSLKLDQIGVILELDLGLLDQKLFATLVANGALLASYRFNKYFTKQVQEKECYVKTVELLNDDPESCNALFKEKKAVTLGVFAARDYTSEPPNVLYPKSYAEMIVSDLEDIGVDCNILNEQEMQELGMGALLGVGQGSTNESQLVIMKYNGLGNDDAPVAFVGKGVTFDTGGISLKPAHNMWDMKNDMGGSAAVVGAIKALALRKAKVNVVGVIGLVENMPSGSAQRPSDVVTTMSGQTAEVLNTDAEGRLVLADAIWYTQEQFNPACVIDLATLTGAIVIALGNTYAGCFSYDDELAKQLIDSSNIVDEKLWRMPLHKDLDDMLRSDIADVANITSAGGAAGSSTAAHFIGRFVKKDTKWAHLDIAGVAWDKKGKDTCPKGSVGYGVRLLNQFIQDYYESK